MELTKQRIIRLKMMPYEEYLKTSEWAEKRDAVLTRDGHRCRACNSEEHLQVHHRTYIRRGYEDLNDLTTLCGPCHEHFHQKISQDEIMLRTYTPPVDPATRAEQKRRDELKWEDYLIGLLIIQPNLMPHVRGIVNEGDFTGEDTKALYLLIESIYPSSNLDVQNLPSELPPAVSRARACVESRTPKDDAGMVKEAIQCIARLKRQRLLQENEDLKRRIREATDAGDSEMLKELQYQLIAVYQQLRTIDTATHMEAR